jgi:AcrR family transcriptional regulator
VSVVPEPGETRNAERAAATRATLLAAARAAFCQNGFSDAAISDVVARAGASVGSLYHHFGGKADLYLALFEEYDRSQEKRAASAVRSAREAGLHDPFPLFLVGARAYLQGAWEDRELARLFLAGDGPPGFDALARRRYRNWTRDNEALLQTVEGPAGHALVMLLTGMMREAGREVAIADTEAAAHAFIEEVLALIGKLGRD